MFRPRGDTFQGDLRKSSLHRLRRLGGSLGVNYCCRDPRDGIREVQAVFVSCPLTTWIGQFGPPRHVRPHFDADSAKQNRSWEHRLPEGRVRCVGHIFERSAGVNWIIVKQLSVAPKQT
jgi:hypothetical protein